MYAKHVGGTRPHDTIRYAKWLKMAPRTNKRSKIVRTEHFFWSDLTATKIDS